MQKNFSLRQHKRRETALFLATATRRRCLRGTQPATRPRHLLQQQAAPLLGEPTTPASQAPPCSAALRCLLCAGLDVVERRTPHGADIHV